jgi:hypothetical protein
MPSGKTDAPDGCVHSEMAGQAAESGGAGNQANAEQLALSKNQQKKLAKRARFVEQRATRKQNRKEQVGVGDVRVNDEGWRSLGKTEGMIVKRQCHESD